MPLFRYKVSDSAMQISEQLIEADSQDDAVRRLQRRGLMPMKFLGGQAAAAGAASSGESRELFRKRFDIVDFTDRLVPLLEAHVPLERALGIVAEGIDHAGQRAIVDSLRKGLHEGRRFSAMLRDRGGIFPPLYVSLAEVGEEAGALPQMMADLRKFLMEKRELKSYMISVSIYPVVVFAVSMLVLGVLLGVIVPRFASVFDVTGGGIQGPMRYLMAASVFIRSYWWTVLLAMAGAVGTGIYLSRRPEFRDKWDALLLKIPGVRRLVILSNLARMTRTMAILMRSGVHILDTVKISSRVLQNHAVRQSVSSVALDLRKGERLADALARSRYMPSTMIRMLAIGEETGEVDMMLEKLGEGYERDLRNLIQRALSLVEPALILSLGLVVALIVVSMFMAILDVQSGI